MEGILVLPSVPMSVPRHIVEPKKGNRDPFAVIDRGETRK